MIILPPRTARNAIKHFTRSLRGFATTARLPSVSFFVGSVVFEKCCRSIQFSKRLYKALAPVPVVIFLVAVEWDDKCVVLDAWSIHPFSLSQGSRLFNWWQKLNFAPRPAEFHPVIKLDFF
jgi:hypothetical protein